MKGDINIMKFRMKKITALMAAAVLGVSTFGGVSVMAAESTEAMAVPADEAGMAGHQSVLVISYNNRLLHKIEHTISSFLEKAECE